MKFVVFFVLGLEGLKNSRWGRGGSFPEVCRVGVGFRPDVGDRILPWCGGCHVEKYGAVHV